MSMTPPDDLDRDVAGFAGLYALDALEGRDLERFEHYMSLNPDTANEVAEFRETAARLVTPQAAPASMRANVLASLSDVRQEPPRLDVERRRRRQQMTRRVAGVAAALLIVLAVGVGGFALGSTDDSPTPGGDELAAIFDQQDAAVVNLSGEAGVSARVVFSSTSGKAVVLADSLAPPPDGYTYELWKLDGEQATSAGLFIPDDDGSVRTTLPVDLDGASGMAVTVEPAGGSEVPTMPLVMSVEI